jgi:hypothetical protein
MPAKNKKRILQKGLHYASKQGIMESAPTNTNDETKAGSKWKPQSQKW